MNIIDLFEVVVKRVCASDELAEGLRVIEAIREHYHDAADAAKPEPLPTPEASAPPVADPRDAEIAALKAQIAEQDAAQTTGAPDDAPLGEIPPADPVEVSPAAPSAF